MLKVIAFDLWETLITDTPAISRAQERMRLTQMESVLLAHGYGADAERIERAYRSLWQRCHELYWSEDRDVPCRRQIEVFLDELGIDWHRWEEGTLAALEHVYATAAVDVPPAAVSGAHEVLGMLRGLHFRTGLISNTGRTPGYALRRILQQLRLAPFIEAMVFSDEQGLCKPDRSIFEALRQALNVSYEEMLFVGDNLYADVLGAQRCGMRAVHFVPPVRGTAVAPSVAHPPVRPDAVVTSLLDLPAVVEALRGS